jgi:hypothetical protein
MNRPRAEFLTRPGLSGDQNAGVTTSDEWDFFDYGAERFTLANQLIQSKLFFERLHQRPASSRLLNQPPYTRKDVISAERRSDEIRDSEFQQSKNVARIARFRQHDD